MKPLLALLFSATLTLAADMSALNDRLILDLPEQAVYGKRSTPLMASNPGDDETLIWIGDGHDRIAVYAEELNILADDDFAKQAKDILEQYNKKDATFEIKSLNDNIFYALRTNTPAQASGSDLIGIALIRHPDHSLIRLSIVFAENHIKAMTDSRTWAENTIRSLRIGAGARNTSARIDKISFFGNHHYEIPIPDGYVRTTHPGHDFIYITYAKLQKADAPADYFGIYLGFHPSFKEPKNAQKVKSTIAGKKATWFCTEPNPTTYAAECCIQLTGGLISSLFADEPDIFMHLILKAPSAATRTTLIQQLSQITPPPPNPPLPPSLHPLQTQKDLKTSQFSQFTHTQHQFS